MSGSTTLSLSVGTLSFSHVNPWGEGAPGHYPMGQANLLRFETADPKVVKTLARYGLVRGVSLLAELRAIIGQRRLLELEREQEGFYASSLWPRQHSAGAQKMALLEKLDRELEALEPLERIISFDDMRAQAAFKARVLARIWEAIAQHKALAWEHGVTWGATHDCLISLAYRAAGYEFPQATVAWHWGADGTKRGRRVDAASFTQADQQGYEAGARFVWHQEVLGSQTEVGRALLRVLKKETEATWDPKDYQAFHWWRGSFVGRLIDFAQRHRLLFIAKVLSVLGVMACFRLPALVAWTHSAWLVGMLEGVLQCTHFAALSIAITAATLLLWLVIRSLYFSAQYWLGRWSSSMASPHRLSPDRAVGLSQRIAIPRYESNVFYNNPIRRLWWGIKNFCLWFHHQGLKSPLAMTGFGVIYLGATMDVVTPVLPAPLHHVNQWWASGLTNPSDWVAAPAAGFTWGKLWLLGCDGLERRERSLVAQGLYSLREHLVDVAGFVGSVAFLAQVESGIPLIAGNMGRWTRLDVWFVTIKPVAVVTDTAVDFKRSVLGSGPALAGVVVPALLRSEGHDLWLLEAKRRLEARGVPVVVESGGLRIKAADVLKLGRAIPGWKRAWWLLEDAWHLLTLMVITALKFPVKYLLFPMIQVFASGLYTVLLAGMLRLFGLKKAVRRVMYHEAWWMRHALHVGLSLEAWLDQKMNVSLMQGLGWLFWGCLGYAAMKASMGGLLGLSPVAFACVSVVALAGWLVCQSGSLAPMRVWGYGLVSMVLAGAMVWQLSPMLLALAWGLLAQVALVESVGREALAVKSCPVAAWRPTDGCDRGGVGLMKETRPVRPSCKPRG